MKKQKGSIDAELTGWLIALSLFGVLIGSWITHIIVCLSAGKWGFLIAGAIFFPIANVHGVGYWFGLF